MNDSILTFWNSQAETHGGSPTASWGDSYAIQLEIDVIGQHLTANSDVLDVGCANGHATLQHIQKNLSSIKGIDFSESMIREARKNSQTAGNPDSVTFEVGDIRHLPVQDNSFDVVYTTRTLINLPTWEEQMTGMKECMRVCRPGGMLIFSEAFWEPLNRLNAMRLLLSLPPLVEHDFNRYLKKAALESFLSDQGLPYEAQDFSAIYYIGSRLLRELLCEKDAQSDYNNPFNKAFFEMEQTYSCQGFGIQQAYIVENKK